MTSLSSATASAAGATAHRLQPLLAPASIALVGASATPGSPGAGMIRSTVRLSRGRRVYLVNPRYQEIEGMPCYPALDALPEAVEHVVLGVANQRLEGQLDAAIAMGAKAATIFGSCYLAEDAAEQGGAPPLARRLAARAMAAGLQICGGNGMGFYNLDEDLRVCAFPPPMELERGGIAFISHSGAPFVALVHNDRRFRFNLAVSPGQELTATAADYLDYALERPSTRVVGLFLESVRDPAGFVAALDKAAARDIPVVVLKVGRTAASAALAVSHSGAIAGNHAAYAALFERYGVMEADDLDDFANTLLLMDGPRRPAAGGLATLHDSGGLRELLVDLADKEQVPFATIGEATRAKLAARLEYGLEPVNPLDAWGTGHDWQGIFADALTALADDPAVGAAGLVSETRDGAAAIESYAEVLSAVLAGTSKPIFLASNMAANGPDALCQAATRAGVPALLGSASALRAVRLAFARRDWRALPHMAPPAPPAGQRARWAARLASGAPLDEAEGLALLADYGVPVLPHRVVDSAEGATAAAAEIGYPVALKTATPGILHKSDVGGVKLGLGTAAAVEAAWSDLAARLGPRVLVTNMAAPGVELAFGAVADPQFGAVVMVGAGGTLIELLDDRRVALPPFDKGWAHRMLDGLKVRPLLDGRRGAAPADVEAVAEALARFSVMVADLVEHLGEVDVNPVIAGPDGCLAVDALVAPRGP